MLNFFDPQFLHIGQLLAFNWIEQISSIDEGKVRYGMFVKAYHDKREHGGINGLTPSEMFLQTFNRSYDRNNTTQKSVTYVGI
jgi:hypothetical protein